MIVNKVRKNVVSAKNSMAIRDSVLLLCVFFVNTWINASFGFVKKE